VGAPDDNWLKMLKERKGVLVEQHHLFQEYLFSGLGIAEIEVHYFEPSLQRRLVYSLVPSRYRDPWYGVVYRKGIAEDEREQLDEFIRAATGRFRERWRGLKNGSPRSIREYIEKKCAGR
jgi:hypothetical protein